MGAAAQIIRFDEIRLAKAPQLTVVLSDLVSTNRIDGLVNVKTDPEAIAHIQLALSSAEYAMQGRRRENDHDVGRKNSFQKILEPHEVFYSVCLTKKKVEIETVYKWSAPSSPPGEELDSAVLQEKSNAKRPHGRANHLARSVAKIAAILALLVGTFYLGGLTYRKYLELQLVQEMKEEITTVANSSLNADGRVLTSPLSRSISAYPSSGNDKTRDVWSSEFYQMQVTLDASIGTPKWATLDLLERDERFGPVLKGDLPVPSTNSRNMSAPLSPFVLWVASTFISTHLGHPAMFNFGGDKGNKKTPSSRGAAPLLVLLCAAAADCELVQPLKSRNISMDAITRLSSLLLPNMRVSF